MISSRTGRSARGVSGRLRTSRSASCSAPSLHKVLPRSTWFIRSFIITPLRDGKDSQSSSARRTESYRVSANISYLGSHTAGPASRNCLYPGHGSSNASSVYGS